MCIRDRSLRFCCRTYLSGNSWFLWLLYRKSCIIMGKKMCIRDRSFYGLQAILGTFIPLFSGGFRTSLFILFTICSIPCAIAAFILYYWNKEHIFNSILYSLPVGALAAEAIVIFIYFLGHHTFLFQLLMDVIGVLIFLFMFYKKAKSKKLFLIASVISALVFYFVFPW